MWALRERERKREGGGEREGLACVWRILTGCGGPCSSKASVEGWCWREMVDRRERKKRGRLEGLDS